MDFLDDAGTRYQLTETSEAPAPAKKPVWPWIVGGLALAGGLVWMASSPRKANPISLDLEALIAEARDPSTPFWRLVELVEHPEEEVRRAVLDNPNVCPTDEEGRLNTNLLWTLAKGFPEEVAGHPMFVLHALIQRTDEMVNVVFQVVEHTTDVALIEQVLRSSELDEWQVRRAVAKNPNTPVDLLRHLGNEATESDWRIRKSVAINPSTPVEVLRILGNPATESWWGVRQEVLLNKRTPEDVIRILSDPSIELSVNVRRTVAERTFTPIDILSFLGNSSFECSSEVREAVARNENTPTETLRTLGNEATESEELVRQAVAENPNTPLDVLRLLGNSQTESEWSVRKAAKKALADRGLT